MGMIGHYVRLPAPDVDRARSDRGWVLGLFHDPAYADRVLDTDKAWHGVQFLLERSGAPVDPVFGGAELAGPPGTAPEEAVLEFPPTRVAAIAAHLSATPFDLLAAHFDPAELTGAGVYPMIWEDPEEDLAYLGGAYRGLVELFTAAAAGGDTVLLWIS
ncbi:hypothetical protein UO65_4030 [Actinokineospora spheciospongiae]|uniref:DUF1877 domain-containing protein n=1 Tax=Actinokineospora spheciospongiae TaxID=909613 RepID=W7IVI1_9PSEU|nr:YfbM family protein [Actinokineospora spheciospongiae]EWC60747.1 hypothetical protein UO65_4030 [Actinokineospora spheciospongiae]